nr:titin homolog isoform X2 [Halyomorpha halys]
MEQQRVWLLQRIFNVDTNPIVIKEGLYKIGRSPESNIFCKSEWVSRCHCDVTVRGGNVFIKDLGSLNGTYIEETEILKERDLQLKDGDIISLGKPFSGEIPETSHYVYRLVECSAPQMPKKRKRTASLSPQNEELSKGSCSPKRIRESVEKQEKDSLIKRQDLTPKQAVVLEEGAKCNQSRNVLPLSTSVGINQVSSSQDMECIDLTNDGSENVLANKSSSSGPLSNEVNTSPDSSDFKNPVLPDSNSSSFDTKAKILQAVLKLLKNHDSDNVLKKIEVLSGGVEKLGENVSRNISVHNQSTAGSNSSNVKNEQMISSNISVSIPDKSSLCQPVEVTNYCLKQNNLNILDDVKVSSLQPIQKNKEQVETKEILDENQDEMKDKKKLCSDKPPTHCPDIGSPNIGSTRTPIQSGLKNPTDASGNIPNDQQNYKPSLKKTRSDSFTSEMEKLDSLLKGLSGNKESNDSLNHNENIVANSINIENESKPIEGQNEICIDLSGSDDDNEGQVDNIKNLYKNIDSTIRDSCLSLRKNCADMSPLQKSNNAVINTKQLKFSRQDKVEEINIDSPLTSKPEKDKLGEANMDSPLRNKPGKDKLEKNKIDSPLRNKAKKVKLEEANMDSPLRNKPEKDKLEEANMDSPSKSNNYESSPFGAEDNILIRIKQEELSLEQNDIEEHMVFSQDMDGVVVIDESEDELEYSQLFMEDEAITEISNEKKNNCAEEEFLYEMNDDNEEMDLFQSHFSQCSQEQESVKVETKNKEPKEKNIKSQLHSFYEEVSGKEQIEVIKSPRSRGKDKRIRDVRVKLRRLDLELLPTEDKEISEEVSESNLKIVKSDYPDHLSSADGLKNNNEIINLNTLELKKCNERNNINLKSVDRLKKGKSTEIIESDSIQIEKAQPSIEFSPKKTKQFPKKKKSDTKLMTKKVGLRKVSIDSNINHTASERDTVGTSCNNKLGLETSGNTLESVTVEPNENCPPSNLIKKDCNRSEINKKIQVIESVNRIVNLPPPDSISGAKLVKSTLLSKPPTARKKTGRPKKTESSVTRDFLNKTRQKQIIETRKAKLKSLALEANSKMIENGEKENAHREVTPRTEQRIIDEENRSLLSVQHTQDKLLVDKSVTKTGSPDKKDGDLIKSIGVAKITERNRGSILLEGLLEDPCRKSRVRKKIEKANSTIVSTEPVAKRSTSYNKVKELSISKEDPVVQVSKVAYGGLKSCLKVGGQRLSNKKVEFDLKADVKLFECEGILRSVNALGLKDKAPSTPIPKPLASPAIPAITTLEETYFDIVHWNASWVNEIKVIPGEPPIHEERYNGKDAYVSYKDYKRWLYPLMMYELWANMCKTMGDEDSNKTGRAFDGIVLDSLQYGVHSSNGKNLLLLKCFFPLYGKQAQSMVEAMDILLIKALSASEGKRICFVMFGLVYSAVKINSYRDTSDPVARHYLTTLNRRPDACAYFDIIIYKSQKKQLTTGFQLRIRPTYNMMTELREFESLIKLASSPLSHIIIDPVTNNSIYLQKDMNNKIVTKYPLNEEQRKAILCTTQSVFANKPSISLVHGPPGTGKTQVIVSIVEQLLYRFKLKNNYKRKKILICSHSNTAIDEICLRLLDIRQQLPRDKRFKLTRYGRKERMHPRVAEIQTATLARKEVEKRNLNEDFTLELSLKKATERMVATALENPESPKIESYKKKYEQVQKRIACLEALVNNKDSSNETRQKEIERMVFDEEMKVIYHSDIIATTLGSCAQRRITKAFSEMSRSGDEKREVGVCIIDEATQATEADSLLPLVYDVKNFILVGDPQQLPPFVASQTAKKLGLCQSLFARLYKVWNGIPSAPVYMLTAQHRMHPEIAKFPSKAFYNGQLTTPPFLAIKRSFKPYAIIKHTLVQDSSETNLSEAKLIVEMASKLLSEPGMKGLSVGLIVPYQKQRSLIQDIFVEKKLLKQLSVNTIDSYQGQERDVILLSIVRTSGVGFLNDHQRLNVALTRARKAMYIVGNFTSLQTTDIWKELLTDAKERNLQFDAGRAEKIEDIFGFLFERNSKKSRTSNS